MSFIEEQIKKYEFQLDLLNSGFAAMVERNEINIVKNKNLLKIILDIIDDAQKSLDYYNKRFAEEKSKYNFLAEYENGCQKSEKVGTDTE